MSDGTQLNLGTTGDLIITEDHADVEGRHISGLTDDDYKMPRSKIAVGPLGSDQGDADKSNPLYIEDRESRRLAEDMMLAALNAQQVSMCVRSYCKVTLSDRRGGLGSQRGTRR